MKAYKCFSWFVLFVFLAACVVPVGGGVTPPAPAAASTPTTSTGSTSVTPVLPTETALPSFPTTTPTATYVNPTPSPVPTLPPIPIITPDSTQVERWQEYQTALAKTLFPSSFVPDEFLCEWEILGQSAQEVYVWAVCMSIFSVEGVGPYGGDIPAVIHVGVDGAVQSVEIPNGGNEYAPDIRRMFPQYAQERYFGGLIHFQELTEHLRWRREHPKELPLIVLSATPTPFYSLRF